MKAIAVCLVFCFATVMGAQNCGQICNGTCETSRKLCELAFFIGPFCDISNTVCTTDCALVCTCVDSCDTQCSGPFDTCRAAGAGNPIALAQCSVQYQMCSAICANKCLISQVSSSIGK